MQEIAKTHKRLIGPRQDEAAVASVHTVIEASHTQRQTTLLVRAHGPLFDPSWDVQEVSMEDIVLAYLSQQARDRLQASPSAREQEGTASGRSSGSRRASMWVSRHWRSSRQSGWCGGG
jgi:hypothetical protein